MKKSLAELDKSLGRSKDITGSDTSTHYQLLDRWYRLETERIERKYGSDLNKQSKTKG
jgi:hypothetical protein